MHRLQSSKLPDVDFHCLFSALMYDNYPQSVAKQRSPSLDLDGFIGTLGPEA